MAVVGKARAQIRERLLQSAGERQARIEFDAVEIAAPGNQLQHRHRFVGPYNPRVVPVVGGDAVAVLRVRDHGALAGGLGIHVHRNFPVIAVEAFVLPVPT